MHTIPLDTLRGLQIRQGDTDSLRAPLASRGSDNPSMATYDSTTNEPHYAASGDGSDRGGRFSPHTTFAKKLRTALLTLKLRVLWDLYCRWYNISAEEEEKVAMHHHRGYALLGSLIHFLPVGASLALVSLNLREVYIGGELVGRSGEDPQKLAALQFAAKLHELLMISSLTAIVLSFIRKRLLFGEGLPFGALFAGQQFKDLSFFWSKEFLATVRHRVLRKTDRFNYLLALLIIATLLGVSVGPSSAQLMRPQLDDWPVGGTVLWLNGPQENVFPMSLESSADLAHCQVDTGNQACPYGGWEIIEKGYTSYLSRMRRSSTLPEWLLIDGPKSQRFMELRIHAPDSLIRPLYTDAYTRATVPISAVADCVSEIGRFWTIAAANIERNKRFWSRKDAKYSIDTIQPAVAINCIPHDITDLDRHGIMFPVLASMVIVPEGGDLPVSNATFPSVVVYNDTDFISAVLKKLKPMNTPDLLWLNALEETGSTLHAVAVFPVNNISIKANNIYSCSLDSRYIPSTTSSTRNRLMVAFTEGHQDYILRGIINTNHPRISLAASWAKYLNPRTGTGDTVFSHMAKTAGLWNALIPPDPIFPTVMVENIVTMMVLNGIARASYNISIAGRAKDLGTSNPVDRLPDAFLKEFLPERYLGPGGNAFDITDAEKDVATELTARVTVNGYAYNRRNATQIAAIVVLLLYCFLAFLHFCYTIWTAEHSNAWDTTPELVALAINSRRSGRLKNMGAGIDTGNVFKEVITIRRDRRNNNLEIIFKNDPEEDTTDGVHTNVRYG